MPLVSLFRTPTDTDRPIGSVYFVVRIRREARDRVFSALVGADGTVGRGEQNNGNLACSGTTVHNFGVGLGPAEVIGVGGSSGVSLELQPYEVLATKVQSYGAVWNYGGLVGLGDLAEVSVPSEPHQSQMR